MTQGICEALPFGNNRTFTLELCAETRAYVPRVRPSPCGRVSNVLCVDDNLPTLAADFSGLHRTLHHH